MKQKILSLILISVLICLYPLQAQWTQISMPGSRGGAVYSICFKDSKLFAGIEGGVYVSSDDGEHWKKVNPDVPPREYNTKVTSIVTNGQNIFAAFYEPGVYLSSDEGQNWTQTEIDAGLRRTPHILTASGDWIIGLEYNSNFQSTDAGISWNQILDVNPIYAASIQDSIALLYGNNGIYRSSDFGSNWIKVHHT